MYGVHGVFAGLRAIRAAQRGNGQPSWAAQNALPPPPPKPPPEKPPPLLNPPPLQPDPEASERGAETNTWCISLAIRCMLLENITGLNAGYGVGETYQLGGSLTMPAK